MLVLSRKVGETIRIGDDITIMVVRIRPDQVGLGIDAPKDVTIVRTELLAQPRGSVERKAEEP